MHSEVHDKEPRNADNGNDLAGGAGMTMTPIRATAAASDFSVVTAEDADGGLRLSVYGDVTESCLDLRDIVLAALRSEPPRLEVELSGVGTVDEDGAAFLLACGRMAKLLGIEYRLTRVGEQAAEALSACSPGQPLSE